MKTIQTFEEIEQIRTLLREAKLRCTTARLTVIHELKQSSSPISHAELSEKLVPLGFDKATVFRNLGDLTEAGLIRRIELGDHVWRFEWCGTETHATEHPHFLCTDCGTVSCLHDVSLEIPTPTPAGSFGEVTEILLKGHCKSCMETSS